MDTAGLQNQHCGGHASQLAGTHDGEKDGDDGDEDEGTRRKEMEKDKTRRDCAYKDFPNKQTNMIAYRHSLGHYGLGLCLATLSSRCMRAHRPSTDSNTTTRASITSPTSRAAPKSLRLRGKPTAKGSLSSQHRAPCASASVSRVFSNSIRAIYFHQKASTLSIRCYVASDRCELSSASPFHGVHRLLGLGLYESDLRHHVGDEAERVNVFYEVLYAFIRSDILVTSLRRGRFDAVPHSIIPKSQGCEVRTGPSAFSAGRLTPWPSMAPSRMHFLHFSLYVSAWELLGLLVRRYYNYCTRTRTGK
ncbi:uncharacterized protein SCHCODRAFT_02064200 [Schizophyllum commune H4-8]|uniref:uncharacterized protein n=1 Tax=Schizophyllum commune (strain H4-8 / FGSC 9210) TaxID=578458 RepID=UPI0021605F4A|nr:uncharacterized protein SCHCODRAFT_02064200 [Schizophyllum commune H4-8]KAI5888851.1 hypothetical protein SCHCODRAFT_02064200 [Schizophyllum commune H4-8]